VPDLAARLACVSSNWTRQSHLHVGNVQWAAAGGDGSPPPSLSLCWGEPMLGFADAWLDEGRADVTLFVSPAASPALLASAVQDIAEIAAQVTVQAARQETTIVGVLTQAGFVPDDDGPWFAQLWRDLADLADLESHPVPSGYTVRPARPDEIARRAEVHRRCWAPARIKLLLGMPVTGDEPESSYTVAKQRAVMASPLYRPELDLVAEDPAGHLVAYGLGWLDSVSESVLFEPVGTDPAHGGRGLARALCSEILRRAAALGATQAVVGPRGDDAYPLPRRVYEGLGMREVAQVITFAHHLRRVRERPERNSLLRREGQSRAAQARIRSRRES
jgi:predicted N-acetyltransferase YhbS